MIRRARVVGNSIHRFNVQLKACERATYSQTPHEDWQVTLRLTAAECHSLTEDDLLQAVLGARKRWRNRAVSSHFQVRFDPMESAIQVSAKAVLPEPLTYELTGLAETIGQVIRRFWEHPMRFGIRPDTLLGSLPPVVIPDPIDASLVYSETLLICATE